VLFGVGQAVIRDDPLVVDGFAAHVLGTRIRRVEDRLLIHRTDWEAMRCSIDKHLL
jgi:hypothetical protein